jgi:hypothetical protein
MQVTLTEVSVWILYLHTFRKLWNFENIRIVRWIYIISSELDSWFHYYYFYYYSALGPVWAGTKAQSGDLYGCGTLHPEQGVVFHCFPPRLDVPTFAARCLHVRNDARDPSSERWNYGRERLSGNIAYMTSLFTPLGIFYMPQIYDMEPTALLPLRRTACWGFFPPGLNPRTSVLKASTVPLDHRSRSWFHTESK